MSGTADPPTRLDQVAVLCSFHYFRRSHHLADLLGTDFGRVRVFADSGGFSASTLGEAVRLRDYVRWLRANASAIDAYANLDVIGDPKTSARNQRVLESEGLHPVPVWHVSSPLRDLEEIAERYDQLAVGGMVPFTKSATRRKLLAWLRPAFRVIARARVLRVHGFGVSAWPLVREFSWTSVDSASMWYARRYRGVFGFDPARSGTFSRHYLTKLDSGTLRAAGAILRRNGVSLRDAADSSKSDLRIRIAFREILRMQEYRSATVPGFLHYFAGMTPSNLAHLLREARAIRSGT